MTIRRLTRTATGELQTEVLEEVDGVECIVKRGSGDLPSEQCPRLDQPEPQLHAEPVATDPVRQVRSAPVARVNPTPVAAIVTCHNYERYLAQCLESLTTQTTPFAEIVCVDDASDDGATVQRICQQYGARYERTDYRDACRARDHGASLTTSPRLVFVDADNWLEPGFLAQHAAVMDTDRKLGLVYAPAYLADAEGTRQGLYTSIHAGTRDELRRENFIDTCCLVRRDALEQVGGWTPGSGPGRFHDWHLWLRVTAAGWPFAYSPEPCWTYRRHDLSMSEQNRANDYATRVRVMQDTYHVAVVTAFCGRDWALERTLQSYAKLGWDPARLHLIANDNSLSGRWGYHLRQKLGKACKGWGSVTVLEDTTRAVQGLANEDLSNNAEPRIRHAMQLNGAIERIYARQVAQHLGPGIDLVFTLEDDIELLGDAVLPRLLSAMHVNTAVVGGYVGQRFTNVPGNHGEGPIAYDVTTEEPYRAKRVPACDSDQPRPVGGLGYGCNLWRAEVWRDLMPCRLSPNDDNAPPWHDVTFSAEVRRAGWELVLHQGVRTRHWREDGTYV